MSMDRSLKTKGALGGIRSVLTRAERIARMQLDKKFEADKNAPLGLPKTLTKR